MERKPFEFQVAKYKGGDSNKKLINYINSMELKNPR
jgi:hypothetical protein